VRPLHADTQAVVRYWVSRDIAQHTVSQCIVTMGVPGDPLTWSWAFTSPVAGGQYVRRYCVNSLCVPFVRRQGACLQPMSLTTSYPSKMVVPALIKLTCSLSASLATTARLPERLQAGGQPPRGGKSLRLGGSDARACPNFCACKLK
jgi:hypothetical protein